MAKIRVLDFPEGKPMREITINTDLESMQEMVGGYIEAVYPWDNVKACLVCNEEGKFCCEPNRYFVRGGRVLDVIHGRFFVCGVSGDEFCSLSKADIDKICRTTSFPTVG